MKKSKLLFLGTLLWGGFTVLVALQTRWVAALLGGAFTVILFRIWYRSDRPG